jgi:hypothetical protein
MITNKFSISAGHRLASCYKSFDKIDNLLWKLEATNDKSTMDLGGSKLSLLDLCNGVNILNGIFYFLFFIFYPFLKPNQTTPTW